MAVSKTDLINAVEKVEKKAEPVKSAVEKKVDKAVKAAKSTAKSAVKKAAPVAEKAKKAAEKAVSSDKVVIQVSGKEDIDVSSLVDACKADYKSKGHRMAKNVCVYVKPEENVAYYTVAGKGSDDFKIDL